MKQEEFYLLTVIVFLAIILIGYIVLSIPAFLYGRRLKIKGSWCLLFPIIRMFPEVKMAKLNNKSKYWYYTFMVSMPILSVLLSIILGGLSFMIGYFLEMVLNTFLYAKIFKNGNVNVPVRTFLNISSGGLGFIGAKPNIDDFEKSKETSFFDLETE